MLRFIPLLLLLLTARIGAQDRPNVLLIVADDLGVHDLGYYGSQIYQTPNIDRLASESRRFERAYANYPRCVPSRYALMTGRYPVVNGDVPDDGMHLSGPALPARWQSAGYRTALFGKWHLGDDPQAAGFDRTWAAGAAGSPRTFHYPFNAIEHPWNARKVPIPDVDEAARAGDYLTDVLTDAVIKDLTTYSPATPFLTIVSYYAVHQPLEAKREDEARNAAEIAAHDFGPGPAYIPEGTGRTKLWQDHPAYAGMVENLDWNIGRLLRKLDTLGLREHTIVVLTSDHGGLSNDGTRQRELATSNHPLRAGKGWLYEGGIRVPLFISWPDHVAPATDTSSLTLLMDLLPGLWEYGAGAQEKTNPVAAALDGQPDTSSRSVFWHAPNARPRNTGDTPASAVISGRWKLLDFWGTGRRELYNLSDDPYETNDLSQRDTARVHELLQQLTTWRKGHGIVLPTE